MRKQNVLQYEAGQAIKECSKCFELFDFKNARVEIFFKRRIIMPLARDGSLSPVSLNGFR